MVVYVITRYNATEVCFNCVYIRTFRVLDNKDKTNFKRVIMFQDLLTGNSSFDGALETFDQRICTETCQVELCQILDTCVV